MVISNAFLCYNSFRCKIYFYLEDDSIQVIEPKVNNSGIPQGLFLWNLMKGNSHCYCLILNQFTNFVYYACVCVSLTIVVQNLALV